MHRPPRDAAAPVSAPTPLAPPTPTSADTAAPWQVRLPFFYGWALVAVTFVMNYISSGVQLWALSVFVVPMQEDLGWSRSAIFLPLTIRGLLSAAAAPFFGKYLDRRLGAIVMVVGGGVLSTVSLALIAGVQERWHFLVLFGLIGGVAGIGQPMTVSGVILSKWFVARRARALLLSTMGTAMAAFTMPLLVTTLINLTSWRTAWIVLAVATFVLLVLPAPLLVRRPEDVGLLPDNASATADAGGRRTAAAAERSWTLGEAARAPTLWLLVFASFAASLSVTGLPGNLVPMFVDKGYSRELAALGLTMYGLFSIFARFTWGILAERTHVRISLMTLGLYAATVMFLLLFLLNSAPAIIVLSAMTGLAIGGLLVLNPLIWPSYFGRHHLGAITGLVQPIIAVAGSGGPLLMALIHDTTDSYRPGILLLGVAWLACSVAMFLARPPSRPAARA